MVSIPADFADFGHDRDVDIVDTLIVMLLHERASLSDPTWRAAARARIERARRALVEYGDAPYSTNVRCELLVDTLDLSARIPGPLEFRTKFALMLFGEAMPNAKLTTDVVKDAVELWPETKRREQRARAVRTLARALDCDASSLMTMLREARKRIRERRVVPRRK